jgi:hypothetical protein
MKKNTEAKSNAAITQRPHLQSQREFNGHQRRG